MGGDEINIIEKAQNYGWPRVSYGVNYDGTPVGSGKATMEGVTDPIIASRTERTILHDMGQEAVAGSPLLDEALSLAERLAEDAASGRVDLADLGRRARKLLESSNKPAESSQLF